MTAIQVRRSLRPEALTRLPTTRHGCRRNGPRPFTWRTGKRRGAGGSAQVCQNPQGLVFIDGKAPDQTDQGVGA